MVYSPTFSWFLWFSCRQIYQSHGSVMGMPNPLPKPAFFSKIACQIPSPQNGGSSWWSDVFIFVDPCSGYLCYEVSLPATIRTSRILWKPLSNKMFKPKDTQVKRKGVQCSKKYPEHFQSSYCFPWFPTYTSNKNTQHTHTHTWQCCEKAPHLGLSTWPISPALPTYLPPKVPPFRNKALKGLW